MPVIIPSADKWNINLTGEPLIGRGCSLLAEIGPKQDNPVTRPLEIHRQDIIELKYRVTVLKPFKPQDHGGKMQDFPVRWLRTFTSLNLSQFREVYITMRMLMRE